MKDSDLDAGKKLLESAKIAAQEVRPSFLMRIWNDYMDRKERRQIESNCQSGKHMVTNWKLKNSRSIIYAVGAHPEKGDLPVEIYDVYEGSCKYCTAPFVKKVSLV